MLHAECSLFALVTIYIKNIKMLRKVSVEIRKINSSNNIVEDESRKDMQMKAMFYRRYGPPDVLHLEEVEKPIPGDGEVLVKILVASVNTLDLSMRGPMLALWLLVKGVNAQHWKEQASTAGGRQ